MIRVAHPGSGSWLFTHFGSLIQGSKSHRIRIRNTENYIAATFQTVLRLSFFSSLLDTGLGPKPEQNAHPDTGLRDSDLLTYKFRDTAGGTPMFFFSYLVFFSTTCGRCEPRVNPGPAVPSPAQGGWADYTSSCTNPAPGSPGLVVLYRPLSVLVRWYRTDPHQSWSDGTAPILSSPVRTATGRPPTIIVPKPSN